ASMAKPSASRPFEALPAVPPSRARRNTPLYRLKTPSRAGSQRCSLRLPEGLDASAAERIFGYRQATITTWLSRAGENAKALHERSFRDLHLPHLQLDELHTRLRSAKQIRLSVVGHRSPDEASSGT